ncbi:2,3-dihydro-2,3-dihydroxybenzoate dehydrogenase [Streptomyces sp. CAU 1734]|uniref:2,3-dihydro-2,3-dihydroxybenzoate dehydrogenase n=1 Tax=Streptomyces sp. CAU 1734 TaxID=3140360 RepID=UPI0032617C1D
MSNANDASSTERTAEKVALVTGAAGGIGAFVAGALAERGVTVAAVDRDGAGLRELAGKAAADGYRIEAFEADVSDGAAVEAVVAEVEQRLGPVEFLVNAAGVMRFGDVLDLGDEDWRATFAVNTDGVFHVSRAVVRAMVPRGRGAVVTVASNAALVARAGMGAYSASKAAAAMLTKGLGLEVARHGIRCNVVAPGSTDTPMLTALWADESGRRATVEGCLETFKGGIPLGKLAVPRDVANAVLFLLSDEASHITLQELTVDGGATLGV